MTSHFFKKAIVLLAILLAPSISLANDAALYDKAIDPNSAFIRVLSDRSATSRVGTKSIESSRDGLTPYVVVLPENTTVTIGSVSAQVDAKSGKFYTVIKQMDTASVIEDRINPNPAKAVLSFYNLTSEPSLDLFVPIAKANAIANLETGNGQSVQLKAPLTLDFVAVADGAEKAEVKGVKLQRGGGTTIVAKQLNGEISLHSEQNSISK